MKTAHMIMIGAGAVGVIFLLSRAFTSADNADFFAPPMQDSADDDGTRCVGYNPDNHPGHVHDNHPGFVFTPHRYPRTSGGEITAIIHNGFAPMRVPRSGWSQWIVNPPSESQWA